MEINYYNFDSIAVNLHDYICKGWSFDYNNKQLNMQIEKGPYQEKNIIVFSNVLSYSAITCDNWGESFHIMGWVKRNEAEMDLYKKCIEEIQQNNYSLTRVNPDTHYIEIEISFISGDILIVLCEKIVI